MGDYLFIIIVLAGIGYFIYQAFKEKNKKTDKTEIEQCVWHWGWIKIRVQLNNHLNFHQGFFFFGEHESEDT